MARVWGIWYWHHGASDLLRGIRCKQRDTYDSSEPRRHPTLLLDEIHVIIQLTYRRYDSYYLY